VNPAARHVWRASNRFLTPIFGRINSRFDRIKFRYDRRNSKIDGFWPVLFGAFKGTEATYSARVGQLLEASPQVLHEIGDASVALNLVALAGPLPISDIIMHNEFA
jgi:hypothetical protein